MMPTDTGSPGRRVTEIPSAGEPMHVGRRLRRRPRTRFNFPEY